MTEPPFTITDARYARGQKLIQAPSSDGFKTRAARLLCALNGRYTNRERGYIVSPTKARRFEALHAAGWDAGAVTRELISPEAFRP